MHSCKCRTMNDISNGTMLSRNVLNASPSGVPLCCTAMSSIETKFAMPMHDTHIETHMHRL